MYGASAPPVTGCCGGKFIDAMVAGSDVTFRPVASRIRRISAKRFSNCGSVRDLLKLGKKGTCR